MPPVLLFALLPGVPANAHSGPGAAAAIVANPVNAAPEEQYMRRIWRIQDGLPEDTVQAIQQSQDGYLWIGTTGGLVRFDGSHFHLYDHATTPALADNSVFCVLSRARWQPMDRHRWRRAWCISRMESFTPIPKPTV